MTKLIRQYERDINALRGRLEVLRELAKRGGIDERQELQRRIELIQTELYELMYQTARMRSIAGPKPITPSLAARRRTFPGGDAAC